MPKVGIVGGGLLGSSIAYHLSRILGEASIVLLDHHPGASCATAQSAGLLVQMNASAAKCRMVEQTRRDITALELGTLLLQNGTLRLASSTEEKAALETEKRILDDACAQPDSPLARWVDADEVKALVPWLEVKNFLGGMFVASDGAIDPQVLAGTYLRVARENGAQVVRKRCSKLKVSTAMDIEQVATGSSEQVATGSSDNRVVICTDDEGEEASITCDHVVVAAGLWSGLLLEGVYDGGGADGGLPMAATRSHYWLSER
jgi:glycine/D-amino acid oxidase-like deaminating enzyme